MPACGRCAKRNKPDQCVYHPAPLTKASNGHTVASDPSSPRVNSFSTAYRSSSSREGPHDSLQAASKRVKLTDARAPQQFLTTIATRSEIHFIDALRRPASDFLSFDDGAEFIGSSAVLAENELSIGILPPVSGTVVVTKVSQHQIDHGAAVLKTLSDLQAITNYIEKSVPTTCAYH